MLPFRPVLAFRQLKSGGLKPPPLAKGLRLSCRDSARPRAVGIPALAECFQQQCEVQLLTI